MRRPRLLTSLGIAGPPLNASPDGNGKIASNNKGQISHYLTHYTRESAATKGNK